MSRPLNLIIVMGAMLVFWSGPDDCDAFVRPFMGTWHWPPFLILIIFSTIYGTPRENIRIKAPFNSHRMSGEIKKICKLFYFFIDHVGVLYGLHETYYVCTKKIKVINIKRVYRTNKIRDTLFCLWMCFQ